MSWGLSIIIEPLLPKHQHRNRRYDGRKPIPDRAGLKGILFVRRNGIPWNPLPSEMGCESSMTCWWRLSRWQQAGIWKRLHAICFPRYHGSAASLFTV